MTKDSSMTRHNSLMLDFGAPDGRYIVTVEDDGKVAYAYLKDGKTIVGDVWLYNRCPTPEAPEWRDRSKIPFANCRGFMSEAGRLEQTVGPDDIEVEWRQANGQPVACVYIFGDLYGVVGVNDK